MKPKYSFINLPERDRERFWARVNKTETCWLWTGARLRDGYAHFASKKCRCMAHRVAYEWLVGPIPDGLELDHLCRVRHCVNPEHLEPVTQRENILRGEGRAAKNARKTHCYRGHELTGDNLSIIRNQRICRTCRREACRLRNQRLRAQQVST